MSRTHALSTALCLSMLLAACGGGGGGSSSNGGTTTPTPTPAATNPCTTAAAADTPDAAAISEADRTPADKKSLIDGNPRGRLSEAIVLNRWADEQRQDRKSVV